MSQVESRIEPMPGTMTERVLQDKTFGYTVAVFQNVSPCRCWGDYSCDEHGHDKHCEVVACTHPEVTELDFYAGSS